MVYLCAIIKDEYSLIAVLQVLAIEFVTFVIDWQYEFNSQSNEFNSQSDEFNCQRDKFNVALARNSS